MELTENMDASNKLHRYLSATFEQRLIVFREGDKEHYGGDIFKAMNPFSAFRALPSNVNHAKDNLVQIECVFDYTRARDTNSQHILFAGHIIRPLQSFHISEVTVSLTIIFSKNSTCLFYCPFFSNYQVIFVKRAFRLIDLLSSED